MQLCRQHGVHARDVEIERNDRQQGQQPLHEQLGPGASHPQHSMHTVQQFRGGDRGYGDRFSFARMEERVEVELSALGRDEHAGVDQRSHRSTGTEGLFDRRTPASTFRQRASSSRHRFQQHPCST
jgi:hypothetical protein